MTKPKVNHDIILIQLKDSPLKGGYDIETLAKSLKLKPIDIKQRLLNLCLLNKVEKVGAYYWYKRQ